MQKLQTHYDAFLLDILGVIHNGVELYPGVLECFQQLIALKKSVLFLSNAPRPGSVLVKNLIKMGLPATPEMVLSSGDLVREQLMHFSDPVFSQLGRGFYHLGAEHNQDILAGLEVQSVNMLEDADFLLLSAYQDPGEDLNQYDALLQKSLSLGLPAICVNPDKIVMNGNTIRYCAGVLAEKYENLGGTVHYYGKPHTAIYESAFEKLKAQGIQNKKQVLMIGDTLETDIKGAAAADFDAALVLTGNMGLAIEKAIDIDPRISRKNFVSQYCDKHNLRLTWVIPGFALDCAVESNLL